VGTTWESFTPGEVIVREGAEDTSLWVVCQGVVEVKVNGRCAGEAGEGAHFGEAQLLGVRHRASQTIRARTAVDVRMLSRALLCQVLSRYPNERVLLGQAAAARRLDDLEKIKPSKAANGQWHIGDLKLRKLEQLFAQDLSPKRSTANPSLMGTEFAHQSLSDWHRELLCGPLGRRLHLSTLASETLQHAAGGKGGIAPTPQQSCASQSQRGTPSPTRRQEDSAHSHRPNSDMLGGTSSSSSYTPAVPPYPRPPRSSPVQRRPNSVASMVSECCVKDSVPGGSFRAFNRPAARAPRRRPPRMARPGVAATRPSSRLDSAAAAYSDCLIEGTGKIPPGFAEAILELSLGAVRAQQSQLSTDSPQKQPPRPPSQCPPAHDSPPPPPTQMLLAAASPASFCFGAFPVEKPRRLEVTLRGTFRGAETAFGEDAMGDYDREEHVVTDDRAVDEEEGSSAEAPPLRASTSTDMRRRLADTHLEDSASRERERMGFGRDELGFMPSGRYSVPAVRGSTSAPPISCHGGVDEGIELESVEGRLQHHIRRLLERSLRGPSRAASCEPVAEGSPEARKGPSPSPPRSLCPSPSPTPGARRRGNSTSEAQDGMLEEMNLVVRARICHRRCGSSSAVLELHLEHCKECSEAQGCFCRPSPVDAEARLLAHFGRHAQLRLTSQQPPVRVLLEPLAESGVGQDDDGHDGGE